jgi:hypothetical protein
MGYFGGRNDEIWRENWSIGRMGLLILLRFDLFVELIFICNRPINQIDSVHYKTTHSMHNPKYQPLQYQHTVNCKLK